MLRPVRAIRYVTPLREGGSLPGLVEADDDGMYVVKFRGAGQGPLVLAAEVVCAALARALGFRVPELVVAEVPRELGVAEPDPEIQELLAASAGANLGVDFLPGALPFTPRAAADADPVFAARLVWFDALVTNVDRTPRNPNLLVWHGETWCIDHGAALFRLHGPTPLSETAGAGFPQATQHVLLPRAASLREHDPMLAEQAVAAVDDAVAAVPGDWIDDGRRAEVAAFLHARLAEPRAWVDELEAARG